MARYLDARGLRWCHVPNGGNRSAKTGALLKAMGVKAGVPDILIFSRIGVWRGVAIELKSSGGIVRDTQREWLDGLEADGWVCRVCYGAAEAIAWVEELIASG